MDVYTLDFTTYVMCSIPLTGIQKEVLVGTLLGDASLERAKPTHNTAPIEDDRRLACAAV